MQIYGVRVNCSATLSLFMGPMFFPVQMPEAMDADMNSGHFFPYSSSIRDLKELFELPSESASMANEKWYIGW